MKKVLIIVATALSISISAQDKLEVLPKAAFDSFIGGYKGSYVLDVPNPSGIGTSEKSIKYSFDYRTRLGVDFKFKGFTGSADVHTFMDWGNEKGKVSFAPKMAQYFVGVSYNYKKVKVKYEHMCNHPVLSKDRVSVPLYGSYDMFSVSYNY